MADRTSFEGPVTTVARSRPLDGLRGVAALGVVSYHCLFGAGFSTPEGTRPGLGMSTASILGNVFFGMVSPARSVPPI